MLHHVCCSYGYNMWKFTQYESVFSTIATKRHICKTQVKFPHETRVALYWFHISTKVEQLFSQTPYSYNLNSHFLNLKSLLNAFNSYLWVELDVIALDSNIISMLAGPSACLKCFCPSMHTNFLQFSYIYNHLYVFYHSILKHGSHLKGSLRQQLLWLKTLR